MPIKDKLKYAQLPVYQYQQFDEESVKYTNIPLWTSKQKRGYKAKNESDDESQKSQGEAGSPADQEEDAKSAGDPPPPDGNEAAGVKSEKEPEDKAANKSPDATDNVETEAAEAAPAEVAVTAADEQKADSNIIATSSMPGITPDEPQSVNPPEDMLLSKENLEAQSAEDKGPIEVTVESVVKEPAESSEMEATEQPTESPETEATEQPVESPETEATEQPIESPETAASEQPAQTPMTEATKQPVESPETEATEQPAKSPETEATEQPAESPETQGTEKSESSSIKHKASEVEGECSDSAEAGVNERDIPSDAQKETPTANEEEAESAAEEQTSIPETPKTGSKKSKRKQRNSKASKSNSKHNRIESEPSQESVMNADSEEGTGKASKSQKGSKATREKNKKKGSKSKPTKEDDKIVEAASEQLDKDAPPTSLEPEEANEWSAQIEDKPSTAPAANEIDEASTLESNTTSTSASAAGNENNEIEEPEPQEAEAGNTNLEAIVVDEPKVADALAEDNKGIEAIEGTVEEPAVASSIEASDGPSAEQTIVAVHSSDTSFDADKASTEGPQATGEVVDANKLVEDDPTSNVNTAADDENVIPSTVMVDESENNEVNPDTGPIEDVTTTEKQVPELQNTLNHDKVSDIDVLQDDKAGSENGTDTSEQSRSDLESKQNPVTAQSAQEEDGAQAGEGERLVEQSDRVPDIEKAPDPSAEGISKSLLEDQHEHASTIAESDTGGSSCGEVAEDNDKVNNETIEKEPPESDVIERKSDSGDNPGDQETSNITVLETGGDEAQAGKDEDGESTVESREVDETAEGTSEQAEESSLVTGNLIDSDEPARVPELPMTDVPDEMEKKENGEGGEIECEDPASNAEAQPEQQANDTKAADGKNLISTDDATSQDQQEGELEQSDNTQQEGKVDAAFADSLKPAVAHDQGGQANAKLHMEVQADGDEADTGKSLTLAVTDLPTSENSHADATTEEAQIVEGGDEQEDNIDDEGEEQNLNGEELHQGGEASPAHMPILTNAEQAPSTQAEANSVQDDSPTPVPSANEAAIDGDDEATGQGRDDAEGDDGEIVEMASEKTAPPSGGASSDQPTQGDSAAACEGTQASDVAQQVSEPSSDVKSGDLHEANAEAREGADDGNEQAAENVQSVAESGEKEPIRTADTGGDGIGQTGGVAIQDQIDEIDQSKAALPIAQDESAVVESDHDMQLNSEPLPTPPVSPADFREKKRDRHKSKVFLGRNGKVFETEDKVKRRDTIESTTRPKDLRSRCSTTTSREPPSKPSRNSTEPLQKRAESVKPIGFFALFKSTTKPESKSNRPAHTPSRPKSEYKEERPKSSYAKDEQNSSHHSSRVHQGETEEEAAKRRAARRADRERQRQEEIAIAAKEAARATVREHKAHEDEVRRKRHEERKARKAEEQLRKNAVEHEQKITDERQARKMFEERVHHAATQENGVRKAEDERKERRIEHEKKHHHKSDKERHHRRSSNREEDGRDRKREERRKVRDSASSKGSFEDDEDLRERRRHHRRNVRPETERHHSSQITASRQAKLDVKEDKAVKPGLFKRMFST